MSEKIVKKWLVAGSAPGQEITLTITFHKRMCRKVTVKYEFEVKSLGWEHYTPAQRWNRATLWIRGVPFRWTYNLYGDRVIWRTSGEFSVDDVDDALTLLEIKFINERLGNYGNDPYTTGVIPLIGLGHLPIPPNDRFDIRFHHGFEDGIIDLPPIIYDYWGHKVPLPMLIPRDPHDRYRCIGWSTECRGFPNLAPPMFKPGDIHLLERGIILYACWEPIPHRCEFFLDEAFKEVFWDRPGEFPNPMFPLYGHEFDLPDLRFLYDKHGRSIYNKPGFVFDGWYWYDEFGKLCHGFRCKPHRHIRFWPRWVPRRYEVVFDFGWGKHQVVRYFTYGEAFSFIDAMINPQGKFIPQPELIRPGYKLVGWTLDVPPGPYHPGMHIPPPPFPFNFHGPIPHPKRIVLHAVWIMLSDIYVYAGEEKGWKFAVPYVYTGEKEGWKMARTYTHHGHAWRM